MGNSRTPVTFFMVIVTICCGVIAYATSASYLLDRSRKTDEARRLDIAELAILNQQVLISAMLKDQKRSADVEKSYRWLDEHGYIKVMPPLRKVVQ